MTVTAIVVLKMPGIFQAVTKVGLIAILVLIVVSVLVPGILPFLE